MRQAVHAGRSARISFVDAGRQRERAAHAAAPAAAASATKISSSVSASVVSASGDRAFKRADDVGGIAVRR